MASTIRSVLAAALLAATPIAEVLAQAYPNKPITVVVAYAPGGGDDFVGRLFARHLSESVGQPVVVENMPGASGTIGYASVVRAPADGYRLVVANSGQTLYPTFYPGLPFNVVESLESIGMIYKTPFAVTVASSVPAKNLTEFIAYARANPGKLNFGSGGNGTANHIAGEIFKKLTGTDLVHIPFKGAGPAFQALLGGQIEVMFATLTTAGLAASNAEGRVRVLAVSGDTRATSMPQIPTAAEAGLQGYDTTIWWGVSAPKGTPPDILAKLNAELRSFVQKQEVQDRFREMGAIPLGTTSADAQQQIARETTQMTEFTRQAGIKP